MQFDSITEAELFKKNNSHLLSQLCEYTETVPNVVRSEIWLNGNAPSFIEGVDDEDMTVICVPIKQPSVQVN